MSEEHKQRTLEMIAVMQAYVDGKPILCRHSLERGFYPATDEPTWSWGNYEYRISDTPDTIDWDYVSPKFNWMARDESGTAFLYQHEPSIEQGTWQDHRAFCSNATSHRSYVRGTIDWKDSLVRRPS